MKILVLGGSGFVGRHVIHKMAQLDWQVTLPTRRAVNARHLQMLPRVQIVECNVHDEATLQKLLPGHDAVINLVAILHGDKSAFNKSHVELPEKLARACLASGVKRLVHVSALGVDDLDPMRAPSNYLRSKGRGEAVLLDAAKQGLQLTLLRPSVIFGADDKFLNLFASLQRLAPFVPLAGAEARFQPVWVDNVAQAVVNCLKIPATIGMTYELCGPQVFSLRQLVQLSARLSGINHGRGRPVIGLPTALGYVQALLMELLPGAPLMSRDNLESMMVDNVTSGKYPGLKALGIRAGSVTGIASGYLRPTN
jgi:NADH dehydrogenase